MPLLDVATLVVCNIDNGDDDDKAHNQHTVCVCAFAPLKFKFKW